MKKTVISLIAFPGAPKEVFERGENILQSILSKDSFIISDKNADVLFILTGGSENQAKTNISDNDLVLIIALNENNSFAASTEIKAYCNQNNISSLVYNIDVEKEIEGKINNYMVCKQAIQNIKGYQIGLIGKVSEWLIASDVNKDLIKNKLGLDLQKVSWDEFEVFQDYKVNSDFINHFKTSEFELEDSSKIYNLLDDIKNKKHLNAISVECFPLVREHAATACLALSKFNSDGFPAGCEGDIPSILGKTIVKELTNQIPWMANLVSIKEDEIFLAHCTIATNLVSNYEVKTHFETNLGTAIQGEYKANTVTVFRLNNELSKAFIAKGEIIERPKREDACRTQVKIKLNPLCTKILKDNPLGNHHLVLQGDYSELLNFYCKLTKIEVI